MVVFYPTLIICIFVLCFAFMKMRERIPTAQRSKIEIILMFILIVFLLIDIGFLIRERRNMTYEANDCIRFFRHYPNHINATDFYFVRKCDDIFDNKKWMEILIKSGRDYNERDIRNAIDSKIREQIEEGTYETGINISDWEDLFN